MDGIKKERVLLTELRNRAQVVIDTTTLSPATVTRKNLPELQRK